MNAWVRSFATGIGLLLIGSGCAGYRLGPTNGELAGSRTVQVVPFTNRTLEPRLSDATTFALRKQIQSEGTFELATHLAGDLIMTGEITRYERTEVSFVPTDVVTGRDFKASMVAHVTVRERYSNRVVMDRQFVGSTLMRVESDLPSVERQSLPLIASDLARKITTALADGSW